MQSIVSAGLPVRAIPKGVTHLTYIYKLGHTRKRRPQDIIIIIMAGMAVFYVAGYLIEERRCPVITASHEDNVLNKFRILRERHVQMRKPYQSPGPGRMKNSSYYIAPVGY